MIVPDSSAWVEFLRGTSHPARQVLRELIKDGAELGVTEVVTLELLAGARSPLELREIDLALGSFELLTLEGLADFEEAARIFRRCRAAGETLRGLLDCLIAVPAIRAGAQILHVNRDFEAIARHTDLELYPLRA